MMVELTGSGVAVTAATYRLFALDIDAALARADPRLRSDPELLRAVGELFGRIAAAFRARAGDRLGVEQALTGEGRPDDRPSR